MIGDLYKKGDFAKVVDNFTYFTLSSRDRALYISSLEKLTDYEKIIKLTVVGDIDVTDIPASMKIGQILWRIGQLNRCFRLYFRMLRAHPQNTDVQVNLFLLITEKNRVKLVRNLLTWILKKNGGINSRLATAYIKRYRSVVELLDILSDATINKPENYAELANAYYFYIYFAKPLSSLSEVQSDKDIQAQLDALWAHFSEKNIEVFRGALRSYKLNEETYINLSSQLIGISAWDDALRVIVAGKYHYPLCVNLNVNHLVCSLNGYPKDEALHTANEIISIFPDSVDIQKNVAAVFEHFGDVDGALRLYQHLADDHQDVVGLTKLPYLLAKLAKFEVARLRWNSVESSKVPHSSLFEALHFDPKPSTAYHRALDLHAASYWKSISLAPVTIGRAHPKIAFISGDIASHAVSNHVFPMICQLAQQLPVDVIGHTLSSNNVTSYFRQHAVTFFDFSMKSALDIGEYVRSKSYDHVIDLTGRTKNGLMRLHRERLAPSVISMLGFPGTMGHPNIDFILCDDILITQEHKKYYSEIPLRLPCLFFPFGEEHFGAKSGVFRRALQIPDGSLCLYSPHKTVKLNDDILRIWAQLSLLNGVYFVIFAEDTEVRARIFERFEADGNKERVRFFPKLRGPQYVELISEMDLMLDCFPFCGGATAIDAVARGLPNLTVCGQAYHNRMSAAINIYSGCEDLVCENLSEYKSIAEHFVTQLSFREKISKNLLRARSGNVFNLNIYAQQFEKLLRAT